MRKERLTEFAKKAMVFKAIKEDMALYGLELETVWSTPEIRSEYIHRTSERFQMPVQQVSTIVKELMTVPPSRRFLLSSRKNKPLEVVKMSDIKIYDVLQKNGAFYEDPWGEDSLQSFIEEMKGKTREEQIDLLLRDFKKALDETRSAREE